MKAYHSVDEIVAEWKKKQEEKRRSEKAAEKAADKDSGEPSETPSSSTEKQTTEKQTMAGYETEYLKLVKIKCPMIQKWLHFDSCRAFRLGLVGKAMWQDYEKMMLKHCIFTTRELDHMSVLRINHEIFLQFQKYLPKHKDMMMLVLRAAVPTNCKMPWLLKKHSDAKKMIASLFVKVKDTSLYKKYASDRLKQAEPQVSPTGRTKRAAGRGKAKGKSKAKTVPLPDPVFETVDERDAIFLDDVVEAASSVLAALGDKEKDEDAVDIFHMMAVIFALQSFLEFNFDDDNYAGGAQEKQLASQESCGEQGGNKKKQKAEEKVKVYKKWPLLRKDLRKWLAKKHGITLTRSCDDVLADDLDDGDGEDEERLLLILLLTTTSYYYYY